MFTVWRFIRLGFGLLGKAFVTICVNVLYVWSAEIYPTEVR